MELKYIKCGEADKHYLCMTCGAQCGTEGHFVEDKDTQTAMFEELFSFFYDVSIGHTEMEKIIISKFKLTRK